MQVKKHLLHQDQLKITNLAHKFEIAVQHLFTLDNSSIEAIHSFTTPSYQDMESKYNEEGIHNCEQVFAYDMLQKDSANTENELSDYNLEMFKKKLAQHTMTEEEYQINKMMLSASQQKDLQYIETHDNETKLHLFITGGAGKESLSYCT